MNWIKEHLIPIFILAFLAFGLGAVELYERVDNQGQQYSKTSNAPAEKSNSRAALKSPVITPLKESPASKPSKQTHDWETYDHQSQVGMLGIAIVATLMTFAGLILVGFTLRYTKRAAEYAADTLKIAQNTITLARETAIIEQRAYLEIKEIRVELTPINNDVEPQSYRFVIEVEVENLGRTPAKDIKIAFDYSSPTKGFSNTAPDSDKPRLDNAFKHLGAGKSKTAGLVASNAYSIIAGRDVKNTAFPRDGRLYIGVVVEIEYRDIFDNNTPIRECSGKAGLIWTDGEAGLRRELNPDAKDRYT